MNTLTDEQRDRVLALLREGKSLRRIENETGHRRETIATYGRRAGLLGAGIADIAAHAARESPYESLQGVIAEKLADGVSLRTIHVDLQRRYRVPASYSGLKRYVRTHLRTHGTKTLCMAA